jgi:hypothetical protein
VTKTRLALEPAYKMLPHCKDGVIFVPLAAVDNGGLVIPAIAVGLDIREKRRIHAELGETRWQTEWTHGLTPGGDQAVTYALEGKQTLRAWSDDTDCLVRSCRMCFQCASA